MKKDLLKLTYKLSPFAFTVMTFFVLYTGVHAQLLPPQDIEGSPAPNFTPQPTANTSSSVIPSPTPNPASSPRVTPPPTPFPSATSTPIPSRTPEPTPFPTASSTPAPVFPPIIDDSPPIFGAPIEEEDPSDNVVIFPLSEIFEQITNPGEEESPVSQSDEDDQNENQTPGEIISPIIPREVLERIIPSGLYKEDGLHPIDGLILLTFGVGFLISGISLLRSDVFLPALSDIESFFKYPFKKKWADSY